MPLPVLFEHPLLKDQAQWLDNQQQGSELPPIVPLAEGAPLVLSFAQQRLWFLAQLEGQSATYNITAALHLEGYLDVTALERTLTTLIQRHHSLRLCFPAVNGTATVKLNDVYNPLSVIDLSEYPETEQHHQVTELIAGHAQTPFDLNTGPLLSVSLLKLGKREHILLFNIHHIIGDGWSMGILIGEWGQLYNAYSQNQTYQLLPPLSIQYTDYAAWQRSWLEGDILEQQLEYWTKQLAGAPELLELPIDYPRPAKMRYRGKRLQSTLDPGLTRGINRLSRENSVTVFMTLLTAFNVLLFRYSGQTDLVVGSPIANRSHHETEDLIGFFINTQVLRTQINGKETFSQLLGQVRQTALKAYNYQDIPFEYLVEQINPARSLSHSPLFQVMFVLEDAPREALELRGLKMSSPESGHTTAKFDLLLSITDQVDGFVCKWEYDTDLFRTDTITRMTGHFRTLLERILDQPEQPVSQLPLLTQTEKEQILAWNQTAVDYPLTLTEAGTPALLSARAPGTIVDLFEEQVEKTPDNIAVVFEEQSISYRSLNTKANQMANYLMAIGVNVETLIGICIEHSFEMLFGLLGILKAGAAYVPLDPSYPLSRLQFMLEDSSAAFLLSQSRYLEQLPVSTAKTVCPDSRWKQIAAGSGENPGRQIGPGNLSYILYTSGSTGNPKGVAMPHGPLYNLMCWHIAQPRLHSPARTLQFTSINFDVSFQEIFSTWSTGGNIVLIAEETRRDGESLVRYLSKHHIQRLYLPFVALDNLARVWEQSRQSESLYLNDIITAGEQLKVTPAVSHFFTGNPGCRLHNHYGPTE
ncbi:MAG: AMP-binding protein, partial [bacterium]|nr:AMP-binding protein [bacterium]